MNPIISIVITVYNKALFLKKCLDSCINQCDINNSLYEIIIVNDGSTDDSLAIIMDYKKHHSNCTIINQENQGLSMARNNGVEKAKGDYIWFVDADDIIASNAICQILTATESQPDVIPIYAHFEHLEHIQNQIPVSVTTGIDILITRKWYHCAPFYVYRRSFLRNNDLRFFPGIYHEDSEFTPRMLFMAKTVKVVDSVLYFVSVDDNSITHVPKIKRAYDCLVVAQHLHDFVIDKKIRDIQLIKCYNDNIVVLINNALLIVCQFPKEEQIKFNNVLLKKVSMLKSLSCISKKYKLEILLFNLFPKHCVEVYKMLKMRRNVRLFRH